MDSLCAGDLRNLPTWKTVQLGLHKSPNEYCAAIDKTERVVSEWGFELLQKVSCSQEQTEVDLVVLSAGGLYPGDEDVRYRDICLKAADLNLELCPAEVGPALSLQYDDQPQGEVLLVAMEPIIDLGGYPHMFEIEHDGSGLWLGGDYCYLNGFCPADTPFVFVRRK